MAPVVVLVGAPGSGKTSVGTALADRLGVEFRDTDHDIEVEVGRSIADQFVDDGEPVFRERERRAVEHALAEHGGVLSLGGGAVLDERTRALLANAQVLWLHVSAGEAATRVGMAVSRPVLMGNVRSRLVTLLNERAPLYEEVADLVIDTDGCSVDEIVDRAEQMVRGGVT